MRSLTTTDSSKQRADRSAAEVVAEAIERFHPRLLLACSFQKEESVLIDLLMQAEPSARVFTIDTGVLFPQTYATWKQVKLSPWRLSSSVKAPFRVRWERKCSCIAAVRSAAPLVVAVVRPKYGAVL